VIRKAAINAFMARKRADLRFYLRLSPDELKTRMLKLPIRPPIWSRLRIKQKMCFLLGAKYERFLFMADPGGGKTLISYSLIRYFMGVKRLKKTLVLVPNKVNKYEWKREAKKHKTNLRVSVLRGRSEDKVFELMHGDADVYVETYGGLLQMLCAKVETKKRGKKKNKMQPDKRLVRQVTKVLQCVILDEITFVKRKGSLFYRLCNMLCRNVDFAFGLTGTPFGRSPTDLWALFYVIDRGYTLGESLGIFRAAFFKAKTNYWGGYEYTFDKTKSKVLRQFIAHRSIRVPVDQEDLPKRVSIIRKVKLPIEAEAYYTQARENIRRARGNYQEIENAFLRMRQISSGFIGYKDDETGERVKFLFDKNPKLDAVRADAEVIPEQHKFIIFHEFTPSGEMLCAMLEELGIGFDRLWSGTKDAEKLLSNFDKSKKTRALVFNFKAGGYGLNLQVARYGMFYESPVPVILRTQTEKRILRPFSPHSRIFQYDYVTEGTADEAILETHREGGDLFRRIIGR